MKYKIHRFYKQPGAENYAYVLEVRDNGKIKAISYNEFTGRATIGFIQNWYPLAVRTLETPQEIVNKIQIKWESMK